MWLNVFFPFAGYLFVAAVATDVCNPKSCSRDSNVEKVICGSDGYTYPNRCIFEKIRCLNKNLTLHRRGPCKQPLSCSEMEANISENSSLKSFTPKCRPDGTFDSEQCHSDVSICWCVTPEGIPLPYTSWTKRQGDSKSKCRRRKSTLKRSPIRNGKNKNRICKRPDKSMLNNNLINTFHSEFIRYHAGQNDSDNIVIEWKFRLLDQNGDDILDKTEYRDLKKIVKKAIKPKKCAKLFPRACDVDRDALISLQEWDDCLTRDGMDDGRSQSKSDDSSDDETEDYEDAFSVQRPPPHGVLHSTLPQGGSFDEDSVEATEDPTDCLSDRKTALSEGSQLYVPECTPDGRYQKIQCYKSAGYCWCVNEDTGKNIPGTSVKNGTPKCDYLKTTLKTMKGCPDYKKNIFLKELLQFLHNKMSEMVNSTSNFNSLAWIDSREEQAATWSFVVFDKNKNKMLERSEWKAFKDMVSTTKGLKKCGKKLPRYCDNNKDRQISMTEWLDCLNIQHGDATISSTISSRSGKKNPLSMLKDD